MMNNKYNGINNRYQYTQDAMNSNEKKLQHILAQNEYDITSKYAADDIDVENSQKFADSFGDEGYSGIFKAMEQGEVSGKRQRIAKNKDEERKQRSMEARQFFEEQDRELREELRKTKVQEYAKEKMKPLITAYAKSMNNMTPENRATLAINIINKSNELLSDNDELASIDGSNPMLWTIKNRDTGEMGVMDMGVLYAGSALQEQELAEWQTSAIIKRDAEAQERESQLQLEKDKLEQKKINDEAMAKAAKDKNDPQITFNNTTASVAATNQQNKVLKLEDKLESSTSVSDTLRKMKKVILDRPNIMTSVYKGVWLEDDPNVIEQLLKKFTLNKEERKKDVNAITELNKYIQQLTIGEASKFARPNMFIERVGAKANPNFNMTPDSFIKIVDDSINTNQKLYLNASKELAKYHNSFAHTGVDQAQPEFGGNAEVQEYVKMRLPNGKSNFVPKDESQSVLDAGGSYE